MADTEFSSYLGKIKERKASSHIYKKYQDIGLQIAELLDDFEHKALYIKLAKEHDEQRLMQIAKDVSGRVNIKNKGAYFMSILYAEQKPKSQTLKSKQNTKYKSHKHLGI